MFARQMTPCSRHDQTTRTQQPTTISFPVRQLPGVWANRRAQRQQTSHTQIDPRSQDDERHGQRDDAYFRNLTENVGEIARRQKDVESFAPIVWAEHDRCHKENGQS